MKLAISRHLGVGELGLYYLATQIAFLPYELSAEVIGSVAFPLYARIQNDIRIAAKTFRNIFSSTAAFLYPVCAMIIVLAPILTEEILGPEWDGTAPIIRVLTVASAVGLLSDSAVSIFLGLGRPHQVTVIEFIQSITLILLASGLAKGFGVVGAAAAWIPAIVASQIITIFFLRRMLVRPFSGLKRPMLAIIVAACAGAIAAFGLNHLASGIFGLVFAGAIGLVAALSVLWLADKHFHLGFVHNLASFYPQVFGRIGLLPAEAGPPSL